MKRRINFSSILKLRENGGNMKDEKNCCQNNGGKVALCERERCKSKECDCGQKEKENYPERDYEEMQEIYHNALAGMDSVEILRPISKDRSFRSLLLKQYKEYSQIATEMEKEAKARGAELKKPSFMAKAMMYMSAKVSTLKDKSSSRLAEIMIQGIDMGIISVVKVVNRLEAENRTNEYVQKMADILAKNLEEMKAFL